MQWRKEMQTQEVPPGYDPVVPTKPKTKSVKRGMKERSKSGFKKITIGFFGFGPKKPDPNRTETGRFGPVLVRFGSRFFSFRFGCFLKVKTEPNRK